MFNETEATKYWEEQTQKGDNPCHYHNPWQDAYAFRVRTRAFRPSDFEGVKLVVDVGCGIGEYTEALSRLTDAHFIGFDFPFNTAIAQERYEGNPQLEFRPGPLPEPAMAEPLKSADVAFTTTVYVHLPPQARQAFFNYVSRMKQGAKFLLLEYMPDEIPPFQKNLPTKEVETLPQVEEKFARAGFTLEEARAVNYIDSFLFFHLGKNAFSYYLTLAFESLLRAVGYKKSKYKLLVFVKS